MNPPLTAHLLAAVLLRVFSFNVATVALHALFHPTLLCSSDDLTWRTFIPMIVGTYSPFPRPTHTRRATRGGTITHAPLSSNQSRVHLPSPRAHTDSWLWPRKSVPSPCPRRSSFVAIVGVPLSIFTCVHSVRCVLIALANSFVRSFASFRSSTGSSLGLSLIVSVCYLLPHPRRSSLPCLLPRV